MYVFQWTFAELAYSPQWTIHTVYKVDSINRVFTSFSEMNSNFITVVDDYQSSDFLTHSFTE